MLVDFISHQKIEISLLLIFLSITGTFLVSKYIFQLPKKMEDFTIEELQRKYIRIDILSGGVSLVSLFMYFAIYTIFVRFLCIVIIASCFTFCFYYRQNIREIKVARKNSNIYENRPKLFD